MHRIIHSVIPRLVICIAFILSGSSEAFTTSPHKNNKWGCHPQTTNTEHHPLRYLQPVELATITTGGRLMLKTLTAQAFAAAPA